MNSPPYSIDAVQNLTEQTFGRIEVSIEEHVLSITLNRAEKKNAMDPTMMNELAFALLHAKYNKEAWIVTLSAKGDFFCAGADLKAFAGNAEEVNSSIPEPDVDIAIGDVFKHLYKPCIAVVQGPVLAGGHLLIAGCTHVVAADEAYFQLPEVKRGLFPFQVMASLSAILSERTLIDFCITGRKMEASKAEKLGLVTKMVDDLDLQDETDKLVASLKLNSPNAIRNGLQAYREIQDMAESHQHQYLRERLMNLIGSEDAQEGLRAFIEKREPKWTNG